MTRNKLTRIDVLDYALRGAKAERTMWQFDGTGKNYHLLMQLDDDVKELERRLLAEQMKVTAKL